MLANLLDNAVRYSPDGGPSPSPRAAASDAVEVSVADEGVGHPAGRAGADLPKFYRGDAVGRRRGAGGAGLGLFIAEGLVSAMGGRIWVDSDEGDGSTFVFELPLAAGVRHDTAG